MIHKVHINEKLYYMTKESNIYYLYKEERLPFQTCKSKRFVEKVIFKEAVARSRYDVHLSQPSLVPFRVLSLKKV